MHIASSSLPVGEQAIQVPLLLYERRERKQVIIHLAQHVVELKVGAWPAVAVAVNPSVAPT
jgi:hypothetical protein